MERDYSHIVGHPHRRVEGQGTQQNPTDRALDQANSIFSYPIPKTNVVKGMRKLSYRRHGEYYRMLSLAAREDLRLIGPKRSGIEAFIKNFPDSWLGIKLFVSQIRSFLVVANF